MIAGRRPSLPRPPKARPARSDHFRLSQRKVVTFSIFAIMLELLHQP